MQLAFRTGASFIDKNRNNFEKIKKTNEEIMIYKWKQKNINCGEDIIENENVSGNISENIIENINENKNENSGGNSWSDKIIKNSKTWEKKSKNAYLFMHF